MDVDPTAWGCRRGWEPSGWAQAEEVSGCSPRGGAALSRFALCLGRHSCAHEDDSPIAGASSHGLRTPSACASVHTGRVRWAGRRCCKNTCRLAMFRTNAQRGHRCQLCEGHTQRPREAAAPSLLWHQLSPPPPAPRLRLTRVHAAPALHALLPRRGAVASEAQGYSRTRRETRKQENTDRGAMVHPP